LKPTERRILICDDLHEVVLETLRARGFEPEVKTGMDEAALVDAVTGTHALIVRSATKVTRPVLEAADALEVVGRAGVGVDNVDTAAATEHGVIVMNTPTGNTTTTGELAIALLCSLSRHVPRADRMVKAGTWKKKGLMGSELTGKTLGVIGLGRIGRVVAERAQGLRMEVIAHDPFLSETGAGSPLDGVTLTELDDLLGRADFVTLHVPLTDDTRGLLDEARLALMKPGARLINCARGGLVDEAALARALDEGRLAGAALDVLVEEPPSQDHPLLGRDDVILTPHLGASSHEAQRNVALQIAEQLASYFETGAPSVSAKVRQALGPYLVLAEKMGAYLAQRASEPICKLEVTVAGGIADSETCDAVRLAALVAVLRQSHDAGINFVNAPILAEARGLAILAGTRADARQFQNLIELSASSKDGTKRHTVHGTAFGGKPRFVSLDGMAIDIAPEGPILITRHHDHPGVLGAIGGRLGEQGVNIRRVELGPPSEANAGFASAFLSLYRCPDATVVDAIRALESIEAVCLVEL
jgi:D-3-phosphoglycerate dehydrogenase